MIFISTNTGFRVMVLEPSNIEKIKAGMPLYAPDGTMIAITNDPLWTMSELTKMMELTEGEVDKKLLDFILSEGLKRPEVKR